MSWVKCFDTQSSLVTDQLLKILVLRLRKARVLPLATMHVPGDRNQMTDIPSRLWDSNPAWKFGSHEELLTLFDTSFPLPSKNSWTVFRPSSAIAIAMKLIFVMRMKHLEMAQWCQLTKLGRSITPIGSAMPGLFDKSTEQMNKQS